jgi:uncharacterized protein
MKKRRKIFLIILALAVVALGVLISFGYFQPVKEATVSFVQHPDLVIRVELAENPLTWTRGLMFRNSLPADSGMLFVFPGEAIQSFWMKNTKIPLDMIFISGDDKIVDIKNNFLPCTADPCPSYQSVAPAKYVLEINGGISQSRGINIGDNVKIEK